MERKNNINQSNNAKYDQFTKDFSSKSKFEDKILSLYSSEYEELMEYLLIKSDTDFTKTLSQTIHSILEDEYTPEIFQNKSLNTLLNKIDKSFTNQKIKKDKQYFEKLLSSKPTILNFTFRKHCNYQENKIFHNCENYLKQETNNDYDDDYNNDNDNDNDNDYNNDYNNDNDYPSPNNLNNSNNSDDSTSQKITDKFITFPYENKLIIICNKCHCVYTSLCIKAYCTFCSIDYYTTLDINNKGNFNNDVQPATWEKYHCNIIYNDQMPCVNCKNAKLYYDIIKNILFCKKCKFFSEPRNILWKCVVCKKEFVSNAKIYNPLEFKMIKKFIKETLMKKEFAFPNYYQCNCKREKFMTHKESCDGKLYKGILRDKEMVICNKCQAITFFDKFIWYCRKCGKRFRGNSSSFMGEELNQLYEESLQNCNSVGKRGSNNNLINSNIDINNNSNNNNNSNSNIENEYEVPNNSSNNNIINNNRSYSSNDSFNNNNNNNNSNNNNNTLNNNNDDNISPDLLDLNPDDYDIISQIGEGSHYKIYACKENDSYNFYALKKRNNLPNAKDTINILKLQKKFSLECPNITAIYAFNHNPQSKEFTILEELAMSDLEKEILSIKRSKSFYKQSQILDLLYQISNACFYLESQGYAHWNITPSNILLFKDKKYKLNNLTYVKNINDNASFNGKSNVKNDKLFSDPFLEEIKDGNKKKFKWTKFDVFSLGLCVFYMATLDIQCVIDVHAIYGKNKSSVSETNEKIVGFVKKSLDALGGKYDVLEEAICGMINLNLRRRFDFEEVIGFLDDAGEIED